MFQIIFLFLAPLSKKRRENSKFYCRSASSITTAPNETHSDPALLLTYRIYRSPYGGVGTYPPHRSASRANNNEESNALRFAAAGGATLSRLHMMQQQGPQAQEAIKRQTMSARGLSDKEFTKHCRGFDVQIKVNTRFYLVILDR